VKPLWAEGLRNPNVDDAGRIISPVPGLGIGTPWGKKPNDNTYWQARGHHTGDDYPGRYGATIVAVLDGTVRYYTDSVLGLIVLLYVQIDGSPYTFWYCHMSKRTVTSGVNVKAGTTIGYVGQTGSGAKFGPHLHLELRAGHSTSWGGPDLLPRW
jgi:murein DD-endopeptidase MepM/ murein hydrolase activator NlpD